jgi:type II secretory pathway pseudopilin PulG
MKIQKRVLIAVALLIAAAAGVGAILRGLRYTARRDFTRVVLTNIAFESRAYFTNFGVWPRTLAELTTTNNPGAMIFYEFDGKQPTDGWGKPISYIPFEQSTGRGSVCARVPDQEGRVTLLEVRFP